MTFVSSLRVGSTFCWRARREEIPSLLDFLVDRLGRLRVVAAPEPSCVSVAGPADFRGGREAAEFEGGAGAVLCRRLRPEGAGGGGIELCVEVWPDRRAASLCRRTESLLALFPVGAVPLPAPELFDFKVVSVFSS